MGKQFDGKVALVTGAASGIGKATAIAFAREGAKVIVSTGQNIQGANQTVDEIKRDGGEAIFIQCDVSNAEQVEAMINQAVDQYGQLDCAFNNAGIGPDGVRVPAVPIVDCPEELWQRHVAVNLTGVFHCLKYEARQMLKQKSGTIVNNSSVSATKVVPGFSPYAATKSGLFGLSKAVALEVVTSGIRVNVICPGLTGRTGLVDNLTGSGMADLNTLPDLVPMKRLGEPEDMAEAVLWLCSEKSSFVTGQILAVDGGMTAT